MCVYADCVGMTGSVESDMLGRLNKYVYSTIDASAQEGV